MSQNGRAGLCCQDHIRKACASGTCCIKCPLRRYHAITEAIELSNLIQDIAEKDQS